MSDYLLPGKLTNISEFTAASGACGPTALSGAIRWATQDQSYTALAVMDKLLSWGLDSTIGVSNTPKLRIAAEKYGFPIQNPTSGESLLGFATHFFDPTPRAAVVLEIANGQALKDSVTGDTEDASNLHYHFICLVGYNPGGVSEHDGGKTLPAGFWVLDGDSNEQNPIINGARDHRGLNTDLQYFTVADLEAAQPYDCFALFPKAGAKPVAISLSDTLVAHYFKAGANGAWTCTNGHSIEAGPLLSFYESYGNAALCGLTFLGLPVADQADMPGVTGVVYQRFERGTLVSDAKHVYDGPPDAGAVYLAHVDSGQVQKDYAAPLIAGIQSQLNAANAKVAAVDAQLAQAQTSDADLKTQLADATSKVNQLDTLVAQLQAQVDQLQKTPLESDADKAAVQALLNLDAAIIAAKKAAGL